MAGQRTDQVRESAAQHATLPPSARKQYWMLFASMFAMMILGWTEGCVGPLLPTLQDFYRVNYSSLSLVWVASFVGSLCAGFSNVFITDRIGFGFAALAGALSLAVSYGVVSLRSTFAVFIFGFILNGFGTSIQDAQVNDFASRLPNVSSGVFQVQACFSLGATIAPFLSTLVVERFKGRPHLFFLLAMGVSTVNALILFLAFKGKRQHQLLGVSPDTGPLHGSGGLPGQVDGDLAAETDLLLPRKRQVGNKGSSDKMLRILRSPAVYALLGWDFFYCGAEVTVSSFLTSYLMTERNGGLSCGYATMGFWAAMTLSRFFFGPLSEKVGYSNAMYIYSVTSLAAQVIGWAIPSLISTSIAYAVVGMMYGPTYPNALMLVSQDLDDDLRVGVMGLMGTVGGAGGAFWPIVVGAMSDRWGIKTFPPMVMGMILISLLCWSRMPKH